MQVSNCCCLLPSKCNYHSYRGSQLDVKKLKTGLFFNASVMQLRLSVCLSLSPAARAHNTASRLTYHTCNIMYIVHVFSAGVCTALDEAIQKHTFITKRNVLHAVFKDGD